MNLVTALVPSETACLASSPGRMRRTAVWISREVTVGFLLYRAREAVSTAIFSKMSAMKEFRIDMAFEEIPVSGCTCFKTCVESKHVEDLTSETSRAFVWVAGWQVQYWQACCTIYLVDVDLVALDCLLGTLLPASAGLFCNCLLGRLGGFLLCFGGHGYRIWKWTEEE